MHEQWGLAQQYLSPEVTMKVYLWLRLFIRSELYLSYIGGEREYDFEKKLLSEH